jgi:hypothetical protein
MRDRMAADPVGRQILAERPRVTVRARAGVRGLAGAVAGSGAPGLPRRLRAMQQTPPPGPHRPRQDEAVAPCWEMPPGTFGAAYAGFMGSRGFHADDRPPVGFGGRRGA